MEFLDRIIRFILEGFAFLIVSIFLFNEISSLLITLGLFDDTSIQKIFFISGLLAVNNVLSKSFFGLKITS